MQSASIKEAEQRWHDEYYRLHGPSEYPRSLEDFRKQFERKNLTPFHQGGWSWWSDIRVEIMKQIGSVEGGRVLDYGCGSGQLAVYLGLLGAQVSGFDLSAEGINTAREAAERYHLRVDFQVLDAERLSYPDNCFDLVVGFGVLHHVIKYPKASAELHRVLAPDGHAVFAESLWDNSLINFARRFTLEEQEAGDAKLTEKGIKEFAKQFSSVEIKKRHLFYMLKRLSSLPVRDLSQPLRARPIWKALKRIDEAFLTIVPLRHWCGEAIVTLRK